MKISPLPLAGAFIIEPEPHVDNRGFFARIWCRRELSEAGIETRLAQMNLAHSIQKGTLRGLHYQEAPHQENKLVQCVRGAIYDVVIDLRPGSPTYKRWLGQELSQLNRKMIFAPRGFAHGYQTLANNTDVLYAVSDYYAPGAEKGIRWDDPGFRIDWPLPDAILVSQKDAAWPDFDINADTGCC